jgi:hypothetical protein
LKRTHFWLVVPAEMRFISQADVCVRAHHTRASVRGEGFSIVAAVLLLLPWLEMMIERPFL